MWQLGAPLGLGFWPDYYPGPPDPDKNQENIGTTFIVPVDQRVFIVTREPAS